MLGKTDLGKLTVRPTTMLRQQVVVALRDAIIRGDLTPGDRLVERELCEKTGVSRTSVREALRHLEAEGLVTTIPNKGPIVNVVSLEDARDIYEIRASLEGLAGSLFAERASEEQIKTLRHCLERAVAVVESGDRHACFAEFTQLREILFDGCGNRLIFDTEQKLRARISFLRLLTLTDDSRLKDTVVEHEAIVSAIEKRDVEGARIACEKHVASAGKVALKLLETRYQGKAGR